MNYMLIENTTLSSTKGPKNHFPMLGSLNFVDFVLPVYIEHGAAYASQANIHSVFLNSIYCKQNKP